MDDRELDARLNKIEDKLEEIIELLTQPEEDDDEETKTIRLKPKPHIE